MICNILGQKNENGIGPSNSILYSCKMHCGLRSVCFVGLLQTGHRLNIVWFSSGHRFRVSLWNTQDFTTGPTIAQLSVAFKCQVSCLVKRDRKIRTWSVMRDWSKCPPQIPHLRGWCYVIKYCTVDMGVPSSEWFSEHECGSKSFLEQRGFWEGVWVTRFWMTWFKWKQIGWHFQNWTTTSEYWIHVHLRSMSHACVHPT